MHSTHAACRWITNSWEAEIFLVFANVDMSKGYKGITCFVVPRSDVKIAKKEQKLGIRASSTCTVAFDDVKVSAENVIGGEGKGYKIAIEILNEGRIGIAGQMIGLAQGAFEKAVPYTYERKQFGQAVGTFQGMAFQIAEAATEIEAARLLTYNAARRKEQRLDFTKEAAMAKWYSSVVAQKVSGQAIEWCGGVGFTRETGIEKYWRDSKIVSCTRICCVNSAEQQPGCDIRGHEQHPVADHRKVHAEAIFSIVGAEDVVYSLLYQHIPQSLAQPAFRNPV